MEITEEEKKEQKRKGERQYRWTKITSQWI